MSRPPSEVFSERMRTTRNIRGLNQTELAERSGLQTSAISHFETGKRKPSFENLKRLADALGVTTDYLLGRVEDRSGLAGPEKLFRDYERLSAGDRKAVGIVIRELAKKTKK